MNSLTALFEHFEIRRYLRSERYQKMFYTRGNKVRLNKFPKGVSSVAIFDSDDDIKKNIHSKSSELKDGKIIEVCTENGEYIYFMVHERGYKWSEYEIVPYNPRK